MRLLRQIDQKQCTHRPFETNVHLIDDTICYGHDLDAAIFHFLEKLSEIGLISTEAVEAFSNYPTKFSGPGISQHCLISGAVIARA